MNSVLLLVKLTDDRSSVTWSTGDTEWSPEEIVRRAQSALEAEAADLANCPVHIRSKTETTDLP